MALSSASSRSNSRGRPGLRGPKEGVTDLSMGGIIGRDHFLIKPENNDLPSICGCRTNDGRVSHPDGARVILAVGVFSTPALPLLPRLRHNAQKERRLSAASWSSR